MKEKVGQVAPGHLLRTPAPTPSLQKIAVADIFSGLNPNPNLTINAT